MATWILQSTGGYSVMFDEIGVATHVLHKFLSERATLSLVDISHLSSIAS